MSWLRVLVLTNPSLYCLLTCSNSIAILLPIYLYCTCIVLVLCLYCACTCIVLVLLFNIFSKSKTRQHSSAWLLAYAALSVIASYCDCERVHIAPNNHSRSDIDITCALSAALQKLVLLTKKRSITLHYQKHSLMHYTTLSLLWLKDMLGPGYLGVTDTTS